ncbi:hypothetical protein [Burkholderia sp. lig30]|jgi:hypothetical protein|uniref:hypothetical protein n=1 Tax=Burkholderia sp. lig30 TaxID=1192124 RepID=UPI00128F8C91|nr:hypothetical protein [Burkholderia sp. lig30]
MQIILMPPHPEFDALRRHRVAKRRVHGGEPATCAIERDAIPAYACARAFYEQYACHRSRDIDRQACLFLLARRKNRAMRRTFRIWNANGRFIVAHAM